MGLESLLQDKIMLIVSELTNRADPQFPNLPPLLGRDYGDGLHHSTLWYLGPSAYDKFAIAIAPVNMWHEQSFLNQRNQTLLMLEVPDKSSKAGKGVFSV